MSGTSIGPEGGVVTSDDGALRLEIPAGEVAQDASISIVGISASEAGLDGVALADTVYGLMPDGLEFSAPVSVEYSLQAEALRLADDTVPFISLILQSGDDWELLPGLSSRDDDVIKVTAEVSHFSELFAVASGRFLGREYSISMFPASFIREKDQWADVDLSIEGELLENIQVHWERHAGLRIDDESSSGARVTCIAIGEFPYQAELIASVERYYSDSARPFGELVYEEDEIAAALGTANCREPSGPDLSAFLGDWTGTWHFDPISGGPPGVFYSADFNVSITEADGEPRIRIQKRGIIQLQEGFLVLRPAAYFYAEGTDGETYSEASFGQLLPNADGTFDLIGLNWGGSPKLAGSLPGFLPAITGATIVEGRIDVENPLEIPPADTHRDQDELILLARQLIRENPEFFEDLAFAHIFYGTLGF